MKIKLREPNPGDLGWLISTHGRIYSQQFDFDSNFEVDIARKVIGFIENSNEFNILLIAQVDGKRVGSVAVSRKPDKTAFVNFLLVKEDYRRYGVARKLIERVISHTQDNNLRLLRLETYSCLEAARELYRKYGFKLYKKNHNIEKYGQIFDQEFWEKKL